MKQAIVSLLLVCICCANLTAQQTDTTKKRETPVYLKYPEMPAFNILLLDSITTLNTFTIPKGRPSMLILFDPDCSHCKAEIKELTAGMDSIRNIDLYFVTPIHTMSEIRAFAEKYHLNDYKNIKAIGRDYEFFFASYYDAKFVPDIALYDENKKILRLFEGHASIKELYEYTHKAK